jgi:hypothetical protein
MIRSFYFGPPAWRCSLVSRLREAVQATIAMGATTAYTALHGLLIAVVLFNPSVSVVLDNRLRVLLSRGVLAMLR